MYVTVIVHVDVEIPISIPADFRFVCDGLDGVICICHFSAVRFGTTDHIKCVAFDASDRDASAIITAKDVIEVDSNLVCGTVFQEDVVDTPELNVYVFTTVSNINLIVPSVSRYLILQVARSPISVFLKDRKSLY